MKCEVPRVVSGFVLFWKSFSCRFGLCIVVDGVICVTVARAELVH